MQNISLKSGRVGPTNGLPCCFTIDGTHQHLSAQNFVGGKDETIVTNCGVGMGTDGCLTFQGCHDACHVKGALNEKIIPFHFHSYSLTD